MQPLKLHILMLDGGDTQMDHGLIKDCSPHVLGMRMKIIYARTRTLPKRLTLGELAQFAVAADFFQCAEAVELAARWMGPLKLHVPSYWTAEIPTWIMVSGSSTTTESCPKPSMPFSSVFYRRPSTEFDIYVQCFQSQSNLKLPRKRSNKHLSL